MDLVNAPFTLWFAGLLGIAPGPALALLTVIFVFVFPLSLVPLIHFTKWVNENWEDLSLTKRILLIIPLLVITVFLMFIEILAIIFVIIFIAGIIGKIAEAFKSR